MTNKETAGKDAMGEAIRAALQEDTFENLGFG